MNINRIKLDNYAKLVGEKNGRRRYRWKVFVDEPTEVLRAIRSVEYHLHPTFPNPIRTSKDPKSGFSIQSAGWGRFNIVVMVEFTDGSELETEYLLDLDKE